MPPPRAGRRSSRGSQGQERGLGVRESRGLGRGPHKKHCGTGAGYLAGPWKPYLFIKTSPVCFVRIGRHSKSLDTQRFVCALCKGQLVLQQPMRKDGRPAKASLTPFAKYVKENYASTKHSQQGLSHGAIMKKLSADFASRP